MTKSRRRGQSSRPPNSGSVAAREEDSTSTVGASGAALSEPTSPVVDYATLGLEDGDDSVSNIKGTKLEVNGDGGGEGGGEIAEEADGADDDKVSSSFTATASTASSGRPLKGGRPGRGGRGSAPTSAVSGTSSRLASGSLHRDRKQLKVEEAVVSDFAETSAVPTEPKRAVRGRAAKARIEEVIQQQQQQLMDESEQDVEMVEGDEVGEDGEGAEGVTRCVCSQDTEEMASGLMIQCDTCKCWQHGPCVGLWGEKDCPDRYFCEECRPSWHGPGGLLRKAHRKAQTPSTVSSHLHRQSPSLPTAGRMVTPPTGAQGGSTPSASASTSSRNKPRESADAALVAAFLAENEVKPTSYSTPPGLAANSNGGGRDSTSSSPIKDGEGDPSQHLGSSSYLSHGQHKQVSPKRSPSAPRDSVDQVLGSSGGAAAGRRGGKSQLDEPKVAPKKRSTMNSRDAAYDDAIAMSILGPGSAAMRARLEKSREGGTHDDRSNSGPLAVEDDQDDVSMEGGDAHSRSASASRESSKLPEARGGGHTTEGDPAPSAKRRRLSLPSRASEFPSSHHSGEGAEPVGEHETIPSTMHETSMQEDVDADETGDGRGVEEDHVEGVNPGSKLESNGGGSTSAMAKANPSVTHSVPVRGDASVTTASHHHQHPPGKAPRSSPSKRGGASGGGATIEHAFRSQRPRDWAPAETGGWGLPEHLKHLSHLLPTPLPVPLQVPAYVKSSTDSSAAATAGATRVPPVVLDTTSATPTRVRFPNKRMTMPEMRKRVRNVSDYLAKVQIEMSERERRNEVVQRVVLGRNNGREDVNGDGKSVDDPVAADPRTATKPISKTGQTDSMDMMDALTKDIILFQQKFFGNAEQ